MAAPQVPELPPSPSRSEPATFAARANAFLGAFPAFRTGINAVATFVNDRSAQVQQQYEVTIAASEAAVNAANVERWRVGSYQSGKAVYSPINFSTYRAKTSHNSSVDPSQDPVNWTQLSISGESLMKSGGTMFGQIKVQGGGTFSNPAIVHVDAPSTGIYWDTIAQKVHTVFSHEGAISASIAPPGLDAPSNNSVITREKGDARYLQIAPGAITEFAGPSPPAGWLICDGSTLSRTTYAALYAAIGGYYGEPSASTFRVPDLRGEFVRGFDRGRGLDAGRGLGTVQGDAIRNITGQFGFRIESYEGTGAFYTTSASAAGNGVSAANLNPNRVTFDASRVVPIANENRPRNVALNYIIRF